MQFAISKKTENLTLKKINISEKYLCLFTLKLLFTHTQLLDTLTLITIFNLKDHQKQVTKKYINFFFHVRDDQNEICN